jgi:hypothetical protein
MEQSIDRKIGTPRAWVTFFLALISSVRQNAMNFFKYKVSLCGRARHMQVSQATAATNCSFVAKADFILYDDLDPPRSASCISTVGILTHSGTSASNA